MQQAISVISCNRFGSYHIFMQLSLQTWLDNFQYFVLNWCDAEHNLADANALVSLTQGAPFANMD